MFWMSENRFLRYGPLVVYFSWCQYFKKGFFKVCALMEKIGVFNLFVFFRNRLIWHGRLISALVVILVALVEPANYACSEALSNALVLEKDLRIRESSFS